MAFLTTLFILTILPTLLALFISKIPTSMQRFLWVLCSFLFSWVGFLIVGVLVARPWADGNVANAEAKSKNEAIKSKEKVK